MHFTTSTMALFALCAALATTQPTSLEKRIDCGEASQYYKPGPNCENTLYASGGGHGGYGCGPASQYYKPGPQCENTLFDGTSSNVTVNNTTTAGEAPPEPSGGSTPLCGPASQWYKPGPNCENTLYTN